MCPVCIATAAILYGSAAGTGGLTALVTDRVLKHRAAKRAQAQAKEIHHGNHDHRTAAEDRLP